MSRLIPRVEKLEARHVEPRPPMSVHILGEHDPEPPITYRDGVALENFIIRIVGIEPLHRDGERVAYVG